MKYYALFKTTHIPLVCFPFILALQLLLKTMKKVGRQEKGSEMLHLYVINQVLKSQQLEDHR